jgi:REP element-mobilizing transposase RayT
LTKTRSADILSASERSSLRLTEETLCGLFALRAQADRMSALRKMKDPAQKEYGWHSRGYLPHFDGGSIPQSITFRLFDSLPKAVLERWSIEVRTHSPKIVDLEMRKRIAAYLDQGHGSCYLKEPRIAKLVQDAILFFDKEKYLLSAWVVMPNHVHLVTTPLPGKPLARIIQSLKSFTANEANKLLERTGTFWMADYFDRYIRNQRHLAAAIAYVENNPVEAGLCKRPEDGRFSSAWFRKHGEW